MRGVSRRNPGAEAHTLKAIVDYLEAKRVRYVRIHPVRLISRNGKTFPGRINPSQRGVPDLVIACPNGKALWIETKAMEGKTWKDQCQWGIDLGLAGHEHHYIRSVDAFLKIAKEHRL